MIDPSKMTQYRQTKSQLEETLIFSLCVAGHNAKSTAKAVDAFLRYIGWNGKSSPFEVIRKYDAMLGEGTAWNGLEMAMRDNGLGCYNLRARCLRSLLASKTNLRTCTAADLESHPGIGPKTSRFFILHSRKDAKVAALDVHILKYLREVGIDAPKATPKGKLYAELEEIFIRLADMAEMSVADFDLMIWNYYTGNSNDIVWVRFVGNKNAKSENRSKAIAC